MLADRLEHLGAADVLVEAPVGLAERYIGPVGELDGLGARPERDVINDVAVGVLLATARTAGQVVASRLTHNFFCFAAVPGPWLI